MTNLFLKAKHWQLFIALLGIPLLVQGYTLFTMFADITSHNPENAEHILNTFSLFPLIMIPFTFVLFGWLWSISIGLQQKIPLELRLNTKKITFFLFFPMVYILSLTLFISSAFYGFKPENLQLGAWIVAIILPLHLFSMFCIFYTMYNVAKTIKTAELQRKVSFSDCIGEFFLLWFYFIGIWIIQPRLNRLVKDEIELK